jgi:hypothetical protein
MKIKKVVLDKSIILGFCILDISKYIMAKHFYRLKKILDFKLLYTDTDSFKIFIPNMDDKTAYNILNQYKESFIETKDSSIKKVPGKLAYEGNHQYFKAIAPKHYITDNKEKCKGVPKHCTTTEYKPERSYYSIRSKEHQIMLVNNIKKIKYIDDKKVEIQNNEVLPYGHYKLKDKTIN